VRKKGRRESVKSFFMVMYGYSVDIQPPTP